MTVGLGKGASDRWHGWLLLGLALLYTLLNALKPLHMDDTAHYYYAARIAAHPLDPYGFQVFWYEQPQDANHVLTPLLSDYWWAVAIRLFGDRVWLWKLWLLPFSLVFVFACYRLLCRIAHGLALPLTALTVLSPTFLPSLNCMLDVPALGLSLYAVLLFLEACDRSSLAQSVLAGLVAGCAMQTKYTALLAPATMLLYAVLFGKLRQGLVAAGIAALLFIGWEGLVALRYGESHFLHHAHDQSDTLVDKLLMPMPMLNVVGGLMPAVVLLGLAALGRTRAVRLAWGGAVVLGYFLIAFIPERFALYSSRFVIGGKFTLGDVVFASFGVVACAVVGAMLCRLGRLARKDWWVRFRAGRYRLEGFLILWLALEAAGCLALSPFPAARRAMGLVVVATFCVGRLASLTSRTTPRRRLVWVIALFGMLLGLVVYLADLRDAYASKTGAEGAAAWIEAQGRPGAVWYVGHWGFQFYAEQAGMQPVVPNRTQLQKGDWLVVPDKLINQQTIQIAPQATELVEVYTVEDWLPLRTVPGYYGGYAPLEHKEGPRLTVRVYRVTADFVPEGKLPEDGGGG
jgi:hypothetical protein